MVTSTYPGQLASEEAHAGHWRFTRETVVTEPLSAQFYELYELTFGPLRSRSVARQVLTKSEFYTQMSDPRVDKYIAWSDDGEPVGITTLTKHLESVPWISPEYFAAHYPDHWARHAVYYLGFTLARPSMRRQGFLEAIIEVGMAPLAAERAVLGYDVCAYNNTTLGFTERINDILERYPLVQLAAVDTQVYYAVTFI
jgi:hypothetical protein